MPGEMVEFAANGSTARGYLSRPDSGSGPGVIVIQEWWGLVDHIKEVADRFAREGYVALAPDLYGGEKTDSPDDASRLMMALNIGEAVKALLGAADYLVSSGGATSTASAAEPSASASSGSAWADSSRSRPHARARRWVRASTSTACTRT